MKKFILSLMVGVSILTCAGIVRAEEAILNEPKNAWTQFLDLASVAEPSGDFMLDFLHDGEARQGASIRVYSFEKWTNPAINKLDVRLGWAGDKAGTLGVSVAMDRLTGIDSLKYAHIGFNGGYDAGENHPLACAVFGFKIEK